MRKLYTMDMCSGAAQGIFLRDSRVLGDCYDAEVEEQENLRQELFDYDFLFVCSDHHSWSYSG